MNKLGIKTCTLERFTISGTRLLRLSLAQQFANQVVNATILTSPMMAMLLTLQPIMASDLPQSNATRVDLIGSGDFVEAAKKLGTEAWTMRQAWLAKPDENLRPATVRFGWEPEAFWVLAELPDDFIASRSSNHGQDMWTLGDVFEIFIARKDLPFYLELHVTPHNHRLHLCWSADGLEKIRSQKAKFDQFRRPPSAFDSWVLQPAGQNKWRVLARIPSSILPNGENFAEGHHLELSFSRYDAGPKGTPDILSSTSPHQKLSYHRRHEWREVLLKGD